MFLGTKKLHCLGLHTLEAFISLSNALEVLFYPISLWRGGFPSCKMVGH